ncbi:MAG TPA: family 16 glycoside hydrolase [Verrucomicrobiae bacterium]
MKPGTVLGADRFLLIEPLGQGGMGVVWLAHDQRLDEDVALKLVPPEIRTDAGALEDLRRETLRSRRLSHPNIIRLHDLNEFPGEPPFISMEFVDGQNVAALKAKQPNRLFTWEQLRPMAKQLCDALDYAHGEKVVHRDLKPANMMVDRRGRLKLADFGLAAVVTELTSRVSLKANTSGTPAYMSPQQMDGRTPRVTDDIYALGATFYELLTSKPPFYHGDISHQVRNLPPDPIEQRLSELELTNVVPAYVSEIILACLAKEPAQRPQNAAVVAEMLQLGGQSVMSTLALGSTQSSVSGSASSVPSVSRTPLSESVAAPSGIPMPHMAAEEPEPLPVEKPKAARGKLVLAVVAGLLVLGVIGFMMRPETVTEGDDSNPPTPVPVNTASANTAPMVSLGRVELFNGRNLDGWSRMGSPDAWRVEDGVIKGTMRLPERAYLISNRRAQNFELTFEYNPARQKEGNGHHGLFYRATAPAPGRIGRGLAMPLEPGPNNGRLLVGDGTGFIDQPITRAEPLKTDDWNQIRVRVEGTRITQAINGVTTYEADRTDLFASPPGDQIMFEIWTTGTGGERSIQIRNIVLQPLGHPQSNSGFRGRVDGAVEWENLYMERLGNTDEFRSIDQEAFPSGSWTVENGILKTIPGSPRVDLFTKRTYGDFAFEMMYTLGGSDNSGVIYRAAAGGRNSFETGAELQLLGADVTVNQPEQSHGALYGLLPPTGAPGMGSYGVNFVEVWVEKGQVQHFLNKNLVLSYDWNSPELRQKIQQSRNFKHPQFMRLKEGHIVIQHYGGDMRIRAMRVRRL